MTDAEKLSQEADSIRERMEAAKGSPAELDMLERTFGERLKHLEARLKTPVAPPGPLSKKTE